MEGGPLSPSDSSASDPGDRGSDRRPGAALFLQVPGAHPSRLLSRELEGRRDARRLLAGRVLVVHLSWTTEDPMARSGPDPAGELASWIRGLGRQLREWSVECPPEAATPERLEGWREGGVTRVAFTRGGPDAIRRARASGIPGVSVEVASADLPTRALRDGLVRLLDAGATEIVLRGREVAQGSDEVIRARHWAGARDTLVEEGLRPAEPWRFHRRGHRSQYARFLRLGRPLVGLGPGAISFRNPMRRTNVPIEADWARRLGAGQDVAGSVERLRPDQRSMERIWTALAGAEGLRLPRSFPEERIRALPGIREGQLRWDGGRLRPTPRGWQELDELVIALLRARSRCKESAAGSGSEPGGSTSDPDLQSFEG